MFDNLSTGGTKLKNIPPILVFQNTGIERDVRFLGLAVPGVKDVHEDVFLALYGGQIQMASVFLIMLRSLQYIRY